MTGTISLLDLLAESQQQAAQRKAERPQAQRKVKTSNVAPRTKEEEAAYRESYALAQRLEWRHTENTLVFTRQLCSCCDTMSATLDGLFQTYTHTRIKTSTKRERVTAFEIDKPKTVIYRDTVVPLCHACADIQQDWPLQALDEYEEHSPIID